MYRDYWAKPSMTRRRMAFVGGGVALIITAAATAETVTDPAVASWLINSSSTHAQSTDCEIGTLVDGVLADVEKVQYDTQYVYITASGVPSYPVGPFEDMNPAAPADQDWGFRLTRAPECACGVFECAACTPGCGKKMWPRSDTNPPVEGVTREIGVWVNGVVIFSPWDGNSFDRNPAPGDPPVKPGRGFWNQNAPMAEAGGFDAALGHPAEGDSPTTFPLVTACAEHHDPALVTGTYHHHQRSPALAAALCDGPARHSAIFGYAFDGYPIYGPYGYANSNGTGGITRMRSSYRLRTELEATDRRDSLPDGTALGMNDWGPPPSVVPIGTYLEDFVYEAGTGDLDERNGRCCITPEYPGGTYAYFTTIDSNGVNAFPYTIGSEYFGAVDTGPDFPPSHIVNTNGAPAYQPRQCETAAWIRVQRLAADVPQTDALFAEDVAIAADVAVAGAPQQSLPGYQPGVALAFRRDPALAVDPWQLEDVLHRLPDGSDIRLGRSVAVDGGAIITGDELHAPSGGVFPFAYDGVGGWDPVASPALVAFSGDNYGEALAVEADLAVVGAWWAQVLPPVRTGAIEILRFNGATWDLEDTQYGDMENARFGSSVAIDEGRIVVGAPGQKAAYLYEESGGSWTLTKYFAPESYFDASFGYSVAICGERIVIGSPNALNDHSQVYVYRLCDNDWLLEQRLEPTEAPSLFPEFGASVAISDDVIFVGAPHLSGPGGTVYVFERCTGGWVQKQVLESPSGQLDDAFGLDVDVSGDWAIVAARYEDDPPYTNSGAAYLYNRRYLLHEATELPVLSGYPTIINDLYAPQVPVQPERYGAGLAWNFDHDAPVVWQETGGVWTIIDLSAGQPLPGRANRIAGSPGSLLVAGALQGVDGQQHATVWQESAGAWPGTPLNHPAGTTAEATSVTRRSDGTFAAVGVVTSTTARPALWIGTTLTTLPGLAPPGEGHAADVVQLPGGDLLIVGSATDAASVRRPVRWRQNGQQYPIAPFPALAGSQRGAAHRLTQADNGSLTVAGEADVAGAQTHPVMWSLDGQTWVVRDFGLPMDATFASLTQCVHDADAGIVLAVGRAEQPVIGSTALRVRTGCATLLDDLNDAIDTPYLLREATAIGADGRTAVQAVPSSAPTAPVRAIVLAPVRVPPAAPGDLDFDGDLDLADFHRVAVCMAGPHVTVPPPGCDSDSFVLADLDVDGDVDCFDFSRFQTGFAP